MLSEIWTETNNWMLANSFVGWALAGLLAGIILSKLFLTKSR